jgi:hypothetical protein
LLGQLEAKRALLAEMEPVAARAEDAYRNRDIDARAYVDLIATRNAKRQEILALELTVREQETALTLLAGAGMPPLMPSIAEMKK